MCLRPLIDFAWTIKLTLPMTNLKLLEMFYLIPSAFWVQFCNDLPWWGDDRQNWNYGSRFYLKRISDIAVNLASQQRGIPHKIESLTANFPDPPLYSLQRCFDNQLQLFTLAFGLVDYYLVELKGSHVGNFIQRRESSNHIFPQQESLAQPFN